MAALAHIPAIRAGHVYESADQRELHDARTGKPLATVSLVNAGLIRRDLAKQATAARALRERGVHDILRRLADAADLFEGATLPVGDASQSPDDYVASLSATSGLPKTLVRKNMAKIVGVCRQMPTVLSGLTRGIDVTVLDRGWAPWNNSTIAFTPVTQGLGVLMPSNSPGVNALWLPSLALKTPVMLKPGREEPWTPFRIIQACLRAGLPPEAFSFYPTDHVGAREILDGCDRALLFGDEQTTSHYRGSVSVQVHGPGWSKVVIGEDCIDRWPEYLDLCVSSILENGGRSCINASSIVVPRHADVIADALAQRLAAVEPRRLDDDQAVLAAFATPSLAERIDAAIQQDLSRAGARDVTAQYRHGGRLVRLDGTVFLLPTIVRCDRFDHPLANREFLFPYASVVEVPQPEIPASIGRSLVVTVISEDERFIRSLLEAPQVDHLHIGLIPTWQVHWDQPHEGNLFEFLYRQRAFQRAS